MHPNPSSSTPVLTQYDTRTIVLHWATAILVVALWLTAQVIDWFPQGPSRVNMRSVHVVLGVLLALVMIRRVVWRTLAGVRLPSVGSPALGRIATFTHAALYVLLIIGILLGFTNLWVRGDSIFNLFTIPSFAPGDRALRRQINGYHDFVANTILVVAGLHALAGLAHHYFWKDDVLRRMWPARARRR